MADEKKPRFQLLGGRLCLDFVNTADWHSTPRPIEKLKSCVDLALWGEAVGLMTPSESGRAAAFASKRPARASRILKRAVVLRETLYRIFCAASAGSTPADKDLEHLNREYSDALSHMQLSWDEVCSWTWRRGGYGRRLAQLYWEAARSAVELLTSPALARVRLCADDRGCGWLFLDNSPNRTRKWCDIRDCGNRAKARRYHLRKRKRS